MKRPRIGALFALLLLGIPPRVPLAQTGNDLEEQLQSEYADKVLTLRHFYTGDHLLFQPDGALVGIAEVGPWTLDSQIRVNKIAIGDHALRIRGRRVCLAFDSKEKPYRDVLAGLAESNVPDRDKLEDFFRAKNVDIEIALASEKPDLNGASSAMKAVFLTPEESIGDFVPDFWRDYLDRIEGRPQTVRQAAEPVYFVKPGEASAPHATYTPNPDFSEEARRAKYQGKMTVAFVVAPSGTVKDVRIVSPLGMGLDDRAVASVSTWKFEPGMKDGKPVSVNVEVEVEFHLY